jgi:hypothetical protein
LVGMLLIKYQMVKSSLVEQICDFY